MPIEHEESTFVRHVPCEACGSSDGNSLFPMGISGASCAKRTRQLKEMQWK